MKNIIPKLKNIKIGNIKIEQLNSDSAPFILIFPKNSKKIPSNFSSDIKKINYFQFVSNINDGNYINKNKIKINYPSLLYSNTKVGELSGKEYNGKDIIYLDEKIKNWLNENLKELPKNSAVLKIKSIRNGNEEYNNKFLIYNKIEYNKYKIISIGPNYDLNSDELIINSNEIKLLREGKVIKSFDFKDIKIDGSNKIAKTLKELTIVQEKKGVDYNSISY